MAIQLDEARLAQLAEHGVTLPPTQDELPYDDGVPMETPRHAAQMHLLIEPLRLSWRDRDEGFVGGNMFVYYSLEQVRDRDFKGPDFFAVLGVPKRERKSWVVWEEGKGPDVVIELLSASTAGRDKTEKKAIYRDRLRVPEYFWFDPFGGELAGFSLTQERYVPIAVGEGDRLVSEVLGLALVRWHGVFEEIEADWLRWATLAGEVLPFEGELAEQARQQAEVERQQAEQARQQAEVERQRAEVERQRAEVEKQRAEIERQRAERLAERLRALGVDPDEA
ncbi:Uma2 family endonuclease [Synechococcus sp. PCC 7336]|uniref:Uma2 family endonuclease n=1 Tax=Synechococcus sp. PCC 7336 TaxID=195250 RepID=UPI000345FE7F|nr:Uma2 family endonuclease [Synechococcus sp. PCC 7336]